VHRIGEDVDGRDLILVVPFANARKLFSGVSNPLLIDEDLPSHPPLYPVSEILVSLHVNTTLKLSERIIIVLMKSYMHSSLSENIRILGG
jgi:hypothetical protein